MQMDCNKENNCVMQLKEYIVKKIAYNRSESFDFTKSQNIKITPIFKREVKDVDHNTAEVILSVVINEIDTPIPFNIEIIISGIFALNNWQEDEIKKTIIKDNGAAILFPFLRNLITSITANSNIPPYIIPIFNVIELFKKNETEKPTNK